MPRIVFCITIARTLEIAMCVMCIGFVEDEWIPGNVKRCSRQTQMKTLMSDKVRCLARDRKILLLNLRIQYDTFVESTDYTFRHSCRSSNRIE